MATGGNNNGCEKGVGEAVGVGVIVGLAVAVGVGVGVVGGVGVAVGVAVGVGVGVDAVYWIVSTGGWRSLEYQTASPSRCRTHRLAPTSRS